MRDFRNLTDSNKKYFEAVWDYCCSVGITPADEMFPGLKSHVAKHTFNMFVYEIGRPEQLKRENELAKISGMGALMK